jgi:hypothetical protein
MIVLGLFTGLAIHYWVIPKVLAWWIVRRYDHEYRRINR